MTKNKKLAALELRRAMQLYAQDKARTAGDDVIMEMASLYPEWAPEQAYQVDDIVKYGVNADGETQLYRVVQAHTSQADWTPDAAASLFSKVGFTADGTVIWTQPLGAHDAYAKGDEVTHKDKLWVSDVDGNIWEPGVYGWTEV